MENSSLMYKVCGILGVEMGGVVGFGDVVLVGGDNEVVVLVKEIEEF